MSTAELDLLVDLVKSKRIHLISNEIYKGTVFGSPRVQPLEGPRPPRVPRRRNLLQRRGRHGGRDEDVKLRPRLVTNSVPIVGDALDQALCEEVHHREPEAAWAARGGAAEGRRELPESLLICFP